MKALGEFLKMMGVWALILLGVLLFLEVVFRFWRHDVEPLAQITQKHVDVLFTPDSVMRSVSSIPGEFDYTAHINHFGYRGRDFVVPKLPGVARVFAVGDSFTFGVGSPDDQTFAALIEKQLRDRGLSVEVINAGIGSTSPATQLLNVKNIHLKYQPDAVVFFFDMTDLWDDWYAERHAVRDRDGDILRFDPMIVDGKRDWWLTLTNYSSFCKFFHNKVVRSIRKMRVLGMGQYMKTALSGARAKAVIAGLDDEKAKSSLMEYDALLLMRGREREALIRQHWARTAANLVKMRDMLASRHIPLVIVMYPHGLYVGGDQWTEGRKTWGFEAGKKYTDYLPFELMKELTDREHIPFINTLDAFLAAPHEKYFFDWDGHMTTAGNRIVASIVAQAPELLGAIGKK
ncbi:MAG: SGNH/GDSL hydrolase family protein [Candidatus Omnitrophota bacterium]